MGEKRGKQEAPAKVSVNSKRLLAASINKRIDYYLSKSTFDEFDLYYLVKDFFREFLELKYEFSLEELKKELDKVFLEPEDKNKILSFIDKIKTIEYEDNKYDTVTLANLMKEFSLITDTLTRSLKEKNTKKGFFASLFGKKNREEPLKKLPMEEKQEYKPLEQKYEEKIYESPIIKPETKKEPEPIKKIVKVEPKEEVKKTIEKKPEPKVKYEVPNISDDKYDWISDGEEETDKNELTNDSKPKDQKKEIEQLIEEGKKQSSKDKLTTLYKRINELYEEENPEGKTKYYSDLLEIYKKIANAK